MPPGLFEPTVERKFERGIRAGLFASSLVTKGVGLWLPELWLPEPDLIRGLELRVIDATYLDHARD